jgi:putative FmdB family regulatory protein
VPIYEYKCENGHLFEAMQRMSDDPLTECQECAAPVVRVLHSPAVHFKGSGFYNTDYGKKKGAANGSGPAGEGSKGSGGSDSGSGSSDSKPSESKSSDSKPKAATAD